MQRINIEIIMNELRSSIEWRELCAYLEKNKIAHNYFLSVNIVTDTINGTYISRNSDEELWLLNRYMYGGQLKGKDVIKSAKDKFISIFINEIKFCPICGKVPLISFTENDKETRLFDLDHFFPKTIYNHLAINFYNLIPTCKGCNYLKIDKNPLTRRDHIFHPYFGFLDNLKGNEDFSDRFSFIDKSIYGSNHSKFFHLEEIYLKAQDTSNDLWFIRDKIEKIKATKTIHFNGLSTEEKKEYFFRNFYPLSNSEILKFSNGKLKKDWIDSIDGII